MKAVNEMTEKREAERKAEWGVVTRLEAIHDKRHQPDESGTWNGTLREDGCLDSGHEGWLKRDNVMTEACLDSKELNQEDMKFEVEHR
jgi:hypothetical protein